MKVDHNKIQLGSDPDPTKNFVIQTPPVQDGTLEIRRGTLDAPGALVAKFDEHGLVDPRELVDVTASRVQSTDYVNTTPMPIHLYFTCVTTAADGLCSATLNGKTMSTSFRPAVGAEIGLNFEIPPGATYRVGWVGAGTVVWREYRLPEGA